jgi:alpha,alpha-trehalose phosphorylase
MQKMFGSWRGTQAEAWQSGLIVFQEEAKALGRAYWDFRNTPPDYYPLLLFYHPLNIYRKQVIKQGAAILAMFLLGYLFSLEARKRNFKFYDYRGLIPVFVR